MFPATGSTMIAASSSPYRSHDAATPSMSLNATTIVSSTTALGTPGVEGMPSVMIPEPALASSASTWPW